MAGSESIWAIERKKVLESAKRSLVKVKDTERRNAKKGWRWITINGRTKVFVPCDKDGNPTKEGRIKIREIQKSL